MVVVCLLPDHIKWHGVDPPQVSHKAQCCVLFCSPSIPLSHSLNEVISSCGFFHTPAMRMTRNSSPFFYPQWLMLLLENQHVWKTSRPGWQLSSWNCVVAILICCVTLEIVPHQDLWLSLDNSQITPSDSGSNLDKQLCFSIYISNLKWSCRFFHYNIRRIHNFLSTSAFSVSCHFEMGLLQLAPGRSDCTKDLSLAKYPEDSCCLNQI